MNAKGNDVRPMRIRIDGVEVTGGGETGGHIVYKLAAMSDDFALFRKIDGTDAANDADTPVQPAA